MMVLGEVIQTEGGRSVVIGFESGQPVTTSVIEAPRQESLPGLSLDEFMGQAALFSVIELDGFEG